MVVEGANQGKPLISINNHQNGMSDALKKKIMVN
jgi:hypothetical protein